MLYRLTDPHKVQHLFAGWEETMITSCLQQVMGTLWVTDPETPQAACACVGCFVFYAGTPDRELAQYRPDGSGILVPQTEAWAALLAACHPHAKQFLRYALRKDTVFDREKLTALAASLPAGYQLRRIDAALYDLCLSQEATKELVYVFDSREHYLRDGLGFVCLQNGTILAGASSYSRYREGIEIEVDTIPEARQKGLATACSAALILACLDRGLYPSWDAQNLVSVHLAEKLGYRRSYDYLVYEVNEREFPRKR